MRQRASVRGPIRGAEDRIVRSVEPALDANHNDASTHGIDRRAFLKCTAGQARLDWLKKDRSGLRSGVRIAIVDAALSSLPANTPIGGAA